MPSSSGVRITQSGRLGRKVIEPADAVEVVLSYYSPLAWRILVATPIACLRAEFTAEDIPLMAIADGRPVGEWAEAVQQGTEHSGRYVRDMVSSGQRIEGPLVCTCVGETADGNLQLRPPYVVSDGWHRGAAWVLHQQANRLYPIGVRVIATERAVPLLGQA